MSLSDESFTMWWRTIAWHEDGAEVHASGERVIVADTGEHAEDALARELRAHLSPPFKMAVSFVEIGERPRGYHMRSYPSAAPPMSTLRAWAFEGRPPSAILRALTVEAKGTSVLDRMVALEHTFFIDIDELAPVAAHGSGVLDDEALDAALGPAFESSRDRWTLPLLLVRAHAEGRSVGPVLHAFYDRRGHGMIEMIKAMMEAFGLSLMVAKSLVDTACSGTQDAELDATLAEAVRARR